MAEAAPSTAEPTARVKIAPPDSAQEHEADRIADRVMSGAASVAPGGPAAPPGTIHRQCATCSAGGAPCDDCGDADEGMLLHRMPNGPVRARGASFAASAVASGGRPLPVATRAYFEPRFGTDLGHVRMHDNTGAGTAAKAINARAYAYGNNIAFAPGEFAPDTSAGQRLIAHELAHVVSPLPDTLQRDFFDDAHMRSLSNTELETLTTPDLEVLLNDIRAAIQPVSSPDNDGLINNMSTIEGILIDRYNRESSEHAVPSERRRTAIRVSEPAQKETFSSAGASAVQSEMHLSEADRLTHWADEESRQDFHREYLDYARDNDPELYADALDYLLELSRQRASDAREAALEQEAGDMGNGSVSVIAAETGLDPEFVEGFLSSYNVPQHPGVIDPRAVPFIQLSAPRFVIASMIKDFIPGMGLYEGITGRDILTNRELATWERILGAALDLLPLAGRVVSGPTRAVARGAVRIAGRTARSLATLGRQMGRSLRGRLPARTVLRIIGRLGQSSPEAVRSLLNRIQGARRAGSNVRLTRPERELLEEIFGAGGRSGRGQRASLLQRQRAAALREEAELLERQAARFSENAARIESTRPAGAHRALQNAEDLRLDAAARRAEAEQFASGRRSATADLPGPDDLDDLVFGSMTAEQPLVRIGLNAAERAGGDLPRIARGLSRSRSGHRVVFRVEGGGSRSRVIIDGAGNVTLRRGATIHFNFGSLARAREFLLKRGEGSRIIAFEVEEAWVRSARSAAIPEAGTARIGGRQPRLVDVTYADDQLEIPRGLLADMEEFIVQGSGRVVEIAQ